MFNFLRTLILLQQLFYMENTHINTVYRALMALCDLPDVEVIAYNPYASGLLILSVSDISAPVN